MNWPQLIWGFLIGALVGVSGTLILLFLGCIALYVLTGSRERDGEAVVT